MNKIKEKIILAENPPSIPGPGMVISTEPPFWVGKVVQFKTEDELASFKAKALAADGNRFFQCQGYRIGILVFDRLDSGPFQYVSQSIGRLMASEYLKLKIEKNGSYFKRYKESYSPQEN